MKKDNDFAYSVGLIRTLETMLLNENEVERMMLAPNANDAFKILNEFDYADNKAGIESVSEFQKVIDEGLVDIKVILEKVLPGEEVLNILWHQYDFHNIKTLLKAKLSGKECEEVKPLMSKMGAISSAALRNFIYDGINSQFGLDEATEAWIKEKIKRTILLFEKEGQNPQVIDLYLDQKLIKLMCKIAKQYNNKFLNEYLKKFVDLTNIRLFFRMKAQEKDQELFNIALLWDGNIDYKKFESAYKHELNEFPELMKATPYGKLIETGLRHYNEEKTFIYLEREIENYLTDYIKTAKLKAFGPEPVIAYFLAKKNNALIIRMIMIAKLNEIDPDEIRNRLRKLYR